MPSFTLYDLHPDFWQRVQTKAKAEGLSVKQVILQLLTAWLAAVLILICTACGSSPTSPTSTPPPVVVVPPVTPPVVPFVTIQTSPCPTTVTGVDPTFYREIGCNGFEAPAALQPTRRWMIAIKVYLKTVDEAGAAVDSVTLDTVENAMIEVAPLWTNGRLPLEGVLRGTDSREGVSGWVTVKWPATPSPTIICGVSDVGKDGGTIAFNYKTPSCGCNGSAIRPGTARHELGHAFGYWHTDNAGDLMSNVGGTKPCDQLPSPRELQAAAFHYR